MIAMRLVQKLSLGFLAATTAILAVNGYFRVHREVALFQADRVRDHDLIGRALGAAVGAVWSSEGEAQAMGLIDAANGAKGESASGGSGSTHRRRRAHRAESHRRGRPGGTMTRIAPDQHGDNERFTYAPLRSAGAPARSSSPSRSTPSTCTRVDDRRDRADDGRVGPGDRAAVVRAGVSFVGRPGRALVAKARRMGQGDFGEPVRIAQRTSSPSSPPR